MSDDETTLHAVESMTLQRDGSRVQRMVVRDEKSLKAGFVPTSRTVKPRQPPTSPAPTAKKDNERG